MSETHLKLIPTDPGFVPEATSCEKAVEALKRLAPVQHCLASEITAIVTEQVQFIDQGGNFERVVCPFCETELTIEFWHKVMDKAYETHFADLSMITACCSTTTSLND